MLHRFVVLLCAVVTLSLQQQQLVYISAATGSDFRGNGTLASPFASLAHVANTIPLQNDVTMTLLDGIHEIQKPILLQNCANILLQGNAQILATARKHPLIQIRSCSNVRFVGLTFVGGFGRELGGGAAQIVNCTNCAFEKCSFLYNRGTFGGALSVRQCANFSISDSNFEGNAAFLIEPKSNSFFQSLIRSNYTSLNASNLYFVENYPFVSVHNNYWS